MPPRTNTCKVCGFIYEIDPVLRTKHTWVTCPHCQNTIAYKSGHLYTPELEKALASQKKKESFVIFSCIAIGLTLLIIFLYIIDNKSNKELDKLDAEILAAQKNMQQISDSIHKEREQQRKSHVPARRTVRIYPLIGEASLATSTTGFKHTSNLITYNSLIKAGLNEEAYDFKRVYTNTREARDLNRSDSVTVVDSKILKFKNGDPPLDLRQIRPYQEDVLTYWIPAQCLKKEEVTLEASDTQDK